ncbi:hypothetical protein POM88_003011 [Heracleum sosnowskyi]|uniref:GAG-pre-integrase domain-containing protein n=1 Tax=Heracleum sosnowskyi TaxID=360622 RepID=A0AAD8JIS6_9APIA|nr:hypothetical protein POM88_003011 [Heracleum sosnowskyi]
MSELRKRNEHLETEFSQMQKVQIECDNAKHMYMEMKLKCTALEKELEEAKEKIRTWTDSGRKFHEINTSKNWKECLGYIADEDKKMKKKVVIDETVIPMTYRHVIDKTKSKIKPVKFLFGNDPNSTFEKGSTSENSVPYVKSKPVKKTEKKNVGTNSGNIKNVKHAFVNTDTDKANPDGVNPGKKKNVLVMDCGCSVHMTGNKALLSEYEEKVGPTVSYGDGNIGQTLGYGNIIIGNVIMKNKESGKTVLTGYRHGNIYEANIQSNTNGSPTCLISKASVDESWNWHKKLSHLNFSNINELVKKDLVKGLPKVLYTPDGLYDACQKAKQRRTSFKSKSESFIEEPYHMLHLDLFGPVNIMSISKKRYTLVIVDEYSRFT